MATLQARCQRCQTKSSVRVVSGLFLCHKCLTELARVANPHLPRQIHK